jgi:YidC/Oxa1 family membrane protein insertase
MDKRTILFVLGLTLIFYLVHQWFEFGSAPLATQPIQEPRTQIVVSDKGTPTLLSESEMAREGIVRLYRDVELKEFLTFAVAKEGNYVTIAPEKGKLPSEVFAQYKEKQTTLVRRLEMRAAPKKAGDPVLYSLFPLGKLEIPYIPADAQFSASLLYFEQDRAYRIEAQVFGDEQLVMEAKPPQNAIVILEGADRSGPYAYYNTEKNFLEYLDHEPSFEGYTLLAFPEKEGVKEGRDSQMYYVLENAYVQLVFTNFNGAACEINLPFHSDENPSSVVRPIGFDRILEKDYLNNDTFPQFPYLISDGKGGTKKMTPTLGGYYPLVRRNIKGKASDTSTWINPHYYAFNLFEKDTDPKVTEYKVKRFEKNLIEFEFSDGKKRITKTFSLPEKPEEAPYCINLDLKVEGDPRNLYLGLGIPEVELISGSFNPVLKYQVLQNQKVKVNQIKPPKDLVSFSYVEANWYCNGNGFFGIILDPLNRLTPGLSVHPVAGQLVPSRITIIDSQNSLYPVDKYPGYAMHTPVSTKPGVTHYRIFAGPFDKKILSQVDLTFADPATGYKPDYIAAQTYHGWFAFISQPFAKFLFLIMNFFHSLTGSWGISIIFLTVVLRLILYPLNNWSMKSTAKLQKLSPKLQQIQEKYKKDPKRVQMETMNLYKREGANPFGGCLPMLIQLPFLFGMFDLLKSSFELRGAPFIPGWINNLTAPDVLFSWNYPLPFFGTSFHLLPVLLGGIMYFQQKFLSLGGGKSAVTDQQKQQKMMGNVMTIVFTVMFYHFPSGLNIYWISSMLLGILQQWWVTKQIQAKG